MEEYLQHAEEQDSVLTKSFWFGKFLQTLSDEVLLSCREHACRTQQQENSPGQPLAETVVATRVTYSHESVISEPIGRDGLPLWLHVQRANVCMQLSESSLSPLVHKVVVQSVRIAALPSLSVLREDHTLDWSEVAIFLGSGTAFCNA